MLSPILKAVCVVFFLILIMIPLSCKEDRNIPEEITHIPVHLELQRFDKRFARATPDSLNDLKQEFPYLFPKQYDDNFWEKKLTDTIQEELDQEVLKFFPDFKGELQDLELLYKHIKFYYPKTKIPKVITVTSEVDYRNPVILADSLLLIALDTYLGSDHKFYQGIQRFYTQNFRKEQIDVDVAFAFAKKIIPPNRGRRFIDEMIYHGKLLYLTENLLTTKPTHEIIGYKPNKLDWAKDNEVNIWTFFVENELLFSTDSKLLQRFINPGPFSKFYLQFDAESPPRLGRYIGWQMVKAYMNKNNIPLQMLAGKSADEIFEQAKYKPKK